MQPRRLRVIELDGWNYRLEHRHTEMSQIDEQVCREAKCECCGHVGMAYLSYYGPRNGYRAFAQCPKCGDTQEF